MLSLGCILSFQDSIYDKLINVIKFKVESIRKYTQPSDSLSQIVLYCHLPKIKQLLVPRESIRAFSMIVLIEMTQLSRPNLLF